MLNSTPRRSHASGSFIWSVRIVAARHAGTANHPPEITPGRAQERLSAPSPFPAPPFLPKSRLAYTAPPSRHPAPFPLNFSASRFPSLPFGNSHQRIARFPTRPPPPTSHLVPPERRPLPSRFAHLPNPFSPPPNAPTPTPDPSPTHAPNTSQRTESSPWISAPAMLFTALRYDTGEIMLSRAEIAEHVGIAPHNVSSIMR